MNNYSDGSYLITKFFPICDGVYLHKELPELLPYSIGSINSYSSLLYYKTGSTGIRIDFESCDNRIVKKNFVFKFRQHACRVGTHGAHMGDFI